jgi:hypothetical protein
MNHGQIRTEMTMAGIFQIKMSNQNFQGHTDLAKKFVKIKKVKSKIHSALNFFNTKLFFVSLEIIK